MHFELRVYPVHSVGIEGENTKRVTPLSIHTWDCKPCGLLGGVMSLHCPSLSYSCHLRGLSRAVGDCCCRCHTSTLFTAGTRAVTVALKEMSAGHVL